MASKISDLKVKKITTRQQNDSDLFWNGGQGGPFLYHYTSAEVLLLKILPHRTLKFGSLKTLNDPKESADWKISFSGQGVTDQDRENAQKIYSEVRHEMKALCLSRDRENNGFSTMYPNHLSVGFCKPRMWAQYGANYTGACLLFNLEKLAAALNKSAGFEIKHGAITYKDELNLGSSTHPTLINALKDRCENKAELKIYIQENITNNFNFHYLEKAKDWESENEYRFLIDSSESEMECLDFGDSLEGVIIGQNFDSNYEKSLKTLTEELGFRLAQLVWENAYPKIDYLIPISHEAAILSNSPGSGSEISYLQDDGNYRKSR